MTHWLLVNSKQNFEISKADNFAVTGMKLRWKKAGAEVQPGDTVFLYLVGLQTIAGELKITSETYFDEAPIWICDKPTESYPWRFKTEPVKLRDADTGLSVKDFIADYEYARKWSPNHSSLAFQGNVHRLNDHDYQLIHKLL